MTELYNWPGFDWNSSERFKTDGAAETELEW